MGVDLDTVVDVLRRASVESSPPDSVDSFDPSQSSTRASSVHNDPFDIFEQARLETPQVAPTRGRGRGRGHGRGRGAVPAPAAPAPPALLAPAHAASAAPVPLAPAPTVPPPAAPAPAPTSTSASAPSPYVVKKETKKKPGCQIC
jgi:hypothetical protein